MFVGFVRDLSERRRIEGRIDQLAAQRLTAMGGMAGALAHELNQPLAAIGVYLETVRRMLARPPDERPARVEDALGLAIEQVMRMGDIINHLRDFVAHGEPDKTHQSLHALVREICSAEFPEGKRFRGAVALSLDAQNDDVLVDKIQIGQVLSNLLRNAREALPDSSTAQLTVSTSQAGADMVRCNVSDNGPGLADEVKEFLFEPLTSTKATGMGIGLSISKSIIEAHYGRIWAESDQRAGTTFSFTLPLATAEIEE
jgi:C4-dicarboxylate-specific signal transduction histidine kinase